jgi:hypothetical protein
VSSLLSESERQLFLAAEALRNASQLSPDPRTARLLVAAATRAELVLLAVRGLRMTPEAGPTLAELTVEPAHFCVVGFDGTRIGDNLTKTEATVLASRWPGAGVALMPRQVQDEQYPTPARAPVSP